MKNQTAIKIRNMIGKILLFIVMLITFIPAVLLIWIASDNSLKDVAKDVVGLIKDRLEDMD